jgi:cyclohexadienyl dehydratase
MESIRPRIESLGRKIIQLLPEHVANIEDFLSYMEIKCLSEKAKHNIFEQLGNADFYVSTSEQVTKSGILRVGTTGDYEPFSIKDTTKKEAVIKGIDADLAKSLATELSVKLVFIDTTWPEIMRDLKENKFDVAMSGISITAERETLAYFSEPYHTGGKIPVSLCSKVQHYSSLKKIDQEGVRLVVNPGGTNEKFLDKNIKHAEKIIYPDNKTIFMEIIEGRADVMITDQIEASVQTEKNQVLCTTQAKPLNLQKKGVLIHQDKDLRNAVNKWLRSVRNSGHLEKVFRFHISVASQ